MRLKIPKKKTTKKCKLNAKYTPKKMITIDYVITIIDYEYVSDFTPKKVNSIKI